MFFCLKCFLEKKIIFLFLIILIYYINILCGPFGRQAATCTMYRLKREEWRQLLLVPCIDWRGKIEDSRVTVQPIGAWQLDRRILFQRTILTQSQNGYWNRDFARFHLIFVILLDFNSILSIFNFFKRFNPKYMFWLVKSYDFTSQNAILTTLVLTKQLNGSVCIHHFPYLFSYFSISIFLEKQTPYVTAFEKTSLNLPLL
jgi:hypothetical protein